MMTSEKLRYPIVLVLVVGLEHVIALTVFSYTQHRNVSSRIFIVHYFTWCMHGTSVRPGRHSIVA